MKQSGWIEHTAVSYNYRIKTPLENISFITFCEIINCDVPNRICLKHILPFSTCLKKLLNQPFLRHVFKVSFVPLLPSDNLFLMYTLPNQLNKKNRKFKCLTWSD